MTNSYDTKQSVSLEITTSQCFEKTSVDLVLDPGTTDVYLPHVVEAGSELAEEEIVTYALRQHKKEVYTTSATVKMRDHPRFCLEAVRGPPVDFTEHFVRTIRVVNNATVALPATATVSISHTACFQPACVLVGAELAPGASVLVDVPHRPLSDDLNLATIEEYTTYTLKANGIVLATLPYRARMYEYSRYLMRYRPSSGGPIRILLSGRAGMGKTSFVRTVCSALSPGDQVLCNVVPVAPTATSGTKSYKLYRCGDALPFAILFDPWGHQPSNYMHDEYSMMIDGLIQPDSHMDHPILEEEAKNRIHSIVLFVAAGNQGVDREEGMVAQAVVKGQNPTTVMSLCESQLNREELKAFRRNPNQLPDHLEVKRKAISALCPGAVLQVAPYVGDQTVKSFEADRLTFRILEQALHAGKSFQQFHAE